MVSEADRNVLLKLARAAITSHPRQAEVRDEALTPVMKEKRGVFVTLTIGGALRGCIGYIEPIKTLYEAVRECAVNAAYGDPRFRPLSKAEFEKVSVEISVLTVPAPLAYKGAEDLLKKLTSDDGVVLSKGARSATFLPQVWEQLPGKEEFLGHLSMKAGLSADAWRGPGITVETYRVEHFSEQELRKPGTAG